LEEDGVMAGIAGSKYFEADLEEHYHLYFIRKKWARLPEPLGKYEYYTPPQMNGGKPWRHSGRTKFLYLRKKFKWESLFA